MQLDELKGQAKAHKDGLATAFNPLREQIESLKNTFWENHREVIEAAAEKYIKHKVKERVTVEVNVTSSVSLAPYGFNRSFLQVKNAIERYCDYLENKERDNEKLKAIMDIS